MTRYDVVVVGAGPAGSTTAALLAERGFTVALLERCTFPRSKPCAEYLSPEAARVLDRLGVLRAVEGEQPAVLHGMRIVSPSGERFEGRFAADHGYRGYRDVGLALPREVLDTHLARAAEARGAALCENAIAEAFEWDATGVTIRGRRGSDRLVVHGRSVVGADGLQSRLARRLRLTRRGALRRIALVTHAVDVAGVGEVGEMHVGRHGYVGLASVGRGITNVSVVADLDRVTPQRPLERWLRALLAGFPEVDTRMRAARLVSPVTAVGPFARHTRRATADRALVVGDAADFLDPFTGEGIYAALRGGELAAEHLGTALGRDRLGRRDLASYDRARRRAFGGKWIVERLISTAIAVPAMFDHAAARLARHPALADLLIGVTGDFVPAAAVLRPGFLWRLVW